MQINTIEKDGISIVDLEGRLDTNTSTEAEKALIALLDGGANKILLNFGGLDFVSSAGLRIVLATAKKLKASGGELRLCSLNEIVQEIFDISGFSTLLNVHKDLDAALGSF
jgi:anti-sigma B factor antagonist